MTEMHVVAHVWYVRGDDANQFFATKLDAEKYARILFPEESEFTRYGRIFYREVFTEK